MPEKFEELFTKYDRRNRKGLDFNEMWELSEANRNIIDPTGWTAEKLEWWATWFIAGDKNVSTLAPSLWMNFSPGLLQLICSSSVFQLKSPVLISPSKCSAVGEVVQSAYR